MSEYIPEISEELLAGFLDEAPEYLEILDEGLMAMEEKANQGSGRVAIESSEDADRMNEMFRAAHSFKGLGAAMGFDKIRDLTHVMETLFDQIRMKKMALEPSGVETLFNVIDRLKALIKELSSPPESPVLIEDAVAALEAILAGETPANISREASMDEPDEPEIDRENVPEPADSVDDSNSTAKPQESNPAAAASNEDFPAVGTDSAVLENKELAQLFVESTLETIDELNNTLLRLEETPDDTEAINDVFRCAHNIKGATGAAGCNALYKMTHDVETVLDLVRHQELKLTEDLMQSVFAAVDRVRADVTMIGDGKLENLTSKGTTGLFNQWLNKPTAAHSTDGEGIADSIGEEDASATPTPEPTNAIDNASGDEDVTPPEVDESLAAMIETTPDDSASETESVVSESVVGETEVSNSGETGDAFTISVTFEKDFIEAEIQAYLINNKLSEVGDVVSTKPDVDSLDGSSPLEQIEFTLKTDADPQAIADVVRSYEIKAVQIFADGRCVESSDRATRAESEPSEPSKEESKAPAKSDSKPAASTNNVKPAAPTPAPKAPVQASTPPAKAKPAAAPSPQQAPAKQPPSAQADNKQRTPAKVGETIRVDLERLDQLMNLGGELVINKARLTQIHGRFDPLFHGQNLGYVVEDMANRLSQLEESVGQMSGEGRKGSRELGALSDSVRNLTEGFSTIRHVVNQVQTARGAMNDFTEALHALNLVSEGMQKRIMETRMVSVGPLFQRFKRVVRDISRATGKRVELILKGEQTELDKRMIDELGDPLTHMIRNSVDHGIETPEQRKAAGKPETAQVVLDAYHRGRHICIEVRDDGKGVAVDKVREKIIERELATPQEVERMTEKEIVQYIFRPGFSTAEQVTDLSGRGMGMDIVLNKLESINGTVEVESVTGQGTIVTIKLPLTLAIITAMISRIGDAVYAIPLECVGEIITATPKEMQFIQKKRVVRVRERVIPVAFFEQIFATNGTKLKTRTRKDETLTLVILEIQDERIGLVVDELIGQEDVVIKSIAENFQNVSGITGASIMGDGRVSLILDVATMMTMFSERIDRGSLEALDESVGADRATLPSVDQETREMAYAG